MGKLSIHKEGRLLCIAESESDSFEPVTRTWIWPTTQSVDRLPEDYDRVEITRQGGSGYGYNLYFYRADSCFNFCNFAVQLPEGGKTHAIRVETEPIPAPRTKVETRYRDGRWQKYLKTKGWVAA